MALAAAGGWYALSPSAYSVEAAPFAGDPACSDVLSKAPRTLLGEGRDEVDGKSAAAWGDASVVLRCGVEPPSSTLDVCVDVDGVHWVLDEKRLDSDGDKVLRTFGRDPAVEVAIDAKSGLSGDALVVLNRTVEKIPQKSKCTDLSDVPL
ncbi:DUF3515 family protein [Streptomyces spirodelae]|uniref:DUF3515 family protein n=1 Tax=Streptomyces spirodelae TaxID=2812904 RepID=A0ABS3WR02_9ACTN|nr:DUF3515 family protein [Streptomyces spirodelae]MBO8185553.1 DUF3515 family protein [Streptomyces spirodelae]